MFVLPWSFSHPNARQRRYSEYIFGVAGMARALAEVASADEGGAAASPDSDVQSACRGQTAGTPVPFMTLLSSIRDVCSSKIPA